jgi:mannose-6-phosphate isomerase-like protein (cupin superfamily)
MNVTDKTKPESKDRFLLNPYTDWTDAQGIPVYEGFGVDMLACETKPWDFTEANGALIHLKGRGDYVSVFLHDLPPGGKTRPMQHCFEEVFYVLEGHGSTRVTLTDGTEHTFEWGPKALFSVPLNTPYQLFNGSGREVAKLSSTTNLPMMLKLFHNDEFVFHNPFRFTEREGLGEFYQGDGELIARSPGRHTWETNFIADLQQFELKDWEAEPCTPTPRKCRWAPTRRATAMDPTSTCSACAAKAIRCSGTRARKRKTMSALTGSTAGCSRRPNRCSISISTRARSPAAMPPRRWEACVTPSRTSRKRVFAAMT